MQRSRRQQYDGPNGVMFPVGETSSRQPEFRPYRAPPILVFKTQG